MKFEIYPTVDSAEFVFIQRGNRILLEVNYAEYGPACAANAYKTIKKGGKLERIFNTKGYLTTTYFIGKKPVAAEVCSHQKGYVDVDEIKIFGPARKAVKVFDPVKKANRLVKLGADQNARYAVILQPNSSTFKMEADKELRNRIFEARDVWIKSQAASHKPVLRP